MFALSLLRRMFRRVVPAAVHESPCDSCPLGACRPGLQATVLCIACHALDAERLRSLGLFEGARVGVVDTRSGMLLDVRGSRLAIGLEVVKGITVRPVDV
ncbi:MAG TPA: FeoA family protein [Gemmatimonadaceae bacterium]|nr:FeoA family protein [Gemmatimonadaceae bacterium]